MARAIMETADTASAVEYMHQCLRLGEGASGNFEAKRILASAWGKLSSDDRRDVGNAFHMADGERQACMLSLAREDRRQRRKLEGGSARGSTDAASDSAEDETMEAPRPTGEPGSERARSRRPSSSVPRVRAKAAQFLGKTNPYGSEGPQPCLDYLRSGKCEGGANCPLIHGPAPVEKVGAGKRNVRDVSLTDSNSSDVLRRPAGAPVVQPASPGSPVPSRSA